jgi:hypothetical protein
LSRSLSWVPVDTLSAASKLAAVLRTRPWEENK